MKLFHFFAILSLFAQSFAPVFAPAVSGLQTGETPTPTLTSTPAETPTETPAVLPIEATSTASATASASPTSSPTDNGTGTPTPTETGTPSPSDIIASATPSATQLPGTATGTPIPTQPAIEINLKADPEFSVPGGEMAIHWSLAGIQAGGQALTLEFTLPKGFQPREKNASFDEAAMKLTVDVKKEAGQFTLLVPQDAAEDAFIQAALLDEGKAVLAGTLLPIPSREQFTLDDTGGEARTRDGRIKVRFPQNALPGQALIAIGRPSGADAPAYSLSDHPFELKARDKGDGRELHEFGGQVEIEVSYADLNVPPGREHDVYLYWYNPGSKVWEGLPTEADPQTKILRAKTNHFSVFDIGINDWQASRMPTVDSFQVSGFTGAGTFSLPIEVPAGPGGLQPGLTLSYNSQVVDQATSNTQPSWVGMGWSLETGSIIRDEHNTSTGSAVTFLLSAGGMSTRIAKDASDIYRPLDENFARVVFDAGANTWTVWDKQGNVYYFEDRSDMADVSDGVILGVYTYQWSLTRVRSIFGKELTYTYAHETKQIGSITTTTAVYPDTILYPNERYRIRFEREARYDYPAWWNNNDGIPHSYERSRLKNVLVEHSYDGLSWERVRRYEFRYAADADTSSIVFPGVRHTDANGQEHRLTTLREVQQYGTTDGEAFPAYTFTYGDNLHLTLAGNGYGGEVRFDYDTDPNQTLYQPWVYIPYSLPNIINEYIFGGLDNPCHGLSTGTWSAYSGSVSCDAGALVVNNGIAVSPDHPASFRPGGAYRIIATHDTLPQNVTVQAGAYDGLYDHYASSGTVFIVRSENGVWTANPRIWVSGGAAYIRTFRIELLPSFYRVYRKTLSDGRGHEYAYTYGYTDAQGNDSAAVNDGGSSAMINAAGYCNAAPCPEYLQRYMEFRGNGRVTETWPDGRKVITTYWQTDDLKGRPKEVQVVDPLGFAMSRTVYTYSTTERTLTGSLTTDKYLKGYAVFQTAQENWTNGSSQNHTGATRSEYFYDDFNYIGDPANTPSICKVPGYGNQTRQVDYTWNNVTGWQVHRTTETFYCPKETVNPYGYNNGSAVYLVSLPVKVRVYDGVGALKGLTINLFDGNTGSHLAQPSQGKLTAVRTLARNGSDYSQVSFVYDTWGNRTDTITYGGYGAWDANPASGAHAVVTGYDSVHHTYPVTQTDYFNYAAYANSLFDSQALATTWDYDYRLGIPTGETDPNGAQTSAQYDGLGRMTKLIRPGDSSGSPTLSMSYVDSFPFTTTISQKLTASSFHTLTRSYDGLGRQYESKINGSITTRTEYDGLNRVISQSTPFAFGETAYYTQTAYNMVDHSTTVTAPDGTWSKTITDGLETTVIEPDTNGGTHSTVTMTDALGRTASVTPKDAAGAQIGPNVSYTYDVHDRLLTASRGGATTWLYYDDAGRKTSMTDPDMGSWSYAYDALGSLTSQTDARGCLLTLTYDSFSRLDTKTSSGNCGQQVSVDYNYDFGANGKGRRTSMSNISNGQTVYNSWTYDARGRVYGETLQIGASYTTYYGYNSADLLTSITYPDGETVNNTYDDRMLLQTVIGYSTYVFGAAYDSAGRIVTRSLGQNNQTGSVPSAGSKALFSPAQQSGPIFSDVPSGYWAQAQIEGLYNLSILSACATGPLQYCPANNLTRADAARDLLRAKYGGFYNPPTPASQRFTDVPPSHWAYNWIDKLAADGITGGCTPTTYCPNDSITRAQMAVFLLKAKHGAGYTPPAASHYFADMSGHWAEAWADEAYREGITSGCGAGNYCPENPVTRDVEAVFIENTFHLIPPPPTATPIPTSTRTPSPTPTVTAPLGARFTQTFNYHPWNAPAQGGRLHTLTVQANGIYFQNLNYAYDLAGNVLTITDSMAGPQTQNFTYDSLNRLKTANAVGGAVQSQYSESYAYDALTGSLAGRNGAVYSYDPNHPHAVSGLNGNTYGYDANGNMIQRTVDGYTYLLGYDAEGHLVSVGAANVPPLSNPQPSPTPAGLASPTPIPSSTATSTATPTPTGTPTQTNTPLPANTQTPTATATATSAPTQTNTPLPANTPTSTPASTPAADLLFADGFESGSLSAWGTTAIDGGDLSVSAASAHFGAYGMQAVVDDLNSIYARKNFASQEAHVTARFYFDPNSLSIPNGQTFDILQTGDATGLTIRVRLNNTAGVYKLATEAQNDAQAWTSGQYIPISDDWQLVEIEWLTSSAAGANDGYLKLWINDTPVDTISNLDNDTRGASKITVGAVASLDAGTAGTLYFDAVEARRGSHIGPLAYVPSENRLPPVTYLIDPTYHAPKVLAAPAHAPLQASLSVTFLYDGDGRRVAQTINSVTTYFVGSYYEVTGSTVTKYYYAGSTRVAMRTGGTLYFMLSDHLGSTSLTTDASGNVISELRYKPWGEVRYDSGVTPTEYTYTGQRSYVESFGLMYYGARWLDVSLGRFAQADSIIPGAGNSQAWDRYSYSFNNPVRYTDPTGHKPCNGEFCQEDGGGKTGGGWVKPPKPQKSQAVSSYSWQGNRILSSGTVYTNTWVTPQSQARDAWLSSKAEESYTLNLPSADMSYWYDLTDSVAGISSDFYSDFDRYSIAAEINWQSNEKSGLLINSIEVKNYSPSLVRLDRVKVSSILGYTDMPGPQTVVGTNNGAPGIINMNVNFRPSQGLNTTMEIRFTSEPSFPDHPYISILIPAGVIPSPGCSIPIIIR